MGEARRRKLATTSANQENEVHEYFASQPPLPRQRGLVVSPPITINGTSLFAKSSNLDPQELRCFTLLWDKIVWPSSRAIYFASGPDEQFLESTGFLTRPDYTFSGFGGEVILRAQLAAFNDLNRSEPGAWSLAQGDASLLVPGLNIESSGNIQLKLTNAIPVPNKDVPLAEVLEFKRKRQDELSNMRHEIDNLAAELNTAQDKEIALEKLIKRVDQSCADAIRVGHEWQFPIRMTNLKTSYKFRPFQTLSGTLVGAFGGQAADLSMSQSVLAGITGAAIATAPAFELSWDRFEWKGLRPRQGPYKYVYQFHNELF